MPSSQASGTCTASAPTAMKGIARSRRSTKTSGNVTENAADTTMKGPNASTSRPRSLPTSAPYSLEHGAQQRAARHGEDPRRRGDDRERDPARRHDMARRADRPSPLRASGTDETRPSDDAVTATSAEAIRYA